MQTLTELFQSARASLSAADLASLAGYSVVYFIAGLLTSWVAKKAWGFAKRAVTPTPMGELAYRLTQALQEGNARLVDGHLEIGDSFQIYHHAIYLGGRKGDKTYFCNLRQDGLLTRREEKRLLKLGKRELKRLEQQHEDQLVAERTIDARRAMWKLGLKELGIPMGIPTVQPAPQEGHTLSQEVQRLLSTDALRPIAHKLPLDHLRPNHDQTWEHLLNEAITQHNSTGTILFWLIPNALGGVSEVRVLQTALSIPKPADDQYPDGYYLVLKQHHDLPEYGVKIPARYVLRRGSSAAEFEALQKKAMEAAQKERDRIIREAQEGSMEQQDPRQLKAVAWGIPVPKEIVHANTWVPCAVPMQSVNVDMNNYQAGMPAGNGVSFSEDNQKRNPRT